MAVQQQKQHLTNGTPAATTYHPNIALLRDANTLLAASSTAVGNLDNGINAKLNNKTNGAFLVDTGASTCNAGNDMQFGAMNLTTNTKTPPILQETEKDGTKMDIDLTLPITSTYLRRMKALGLSTGFEHIYGHPNVTLSNVSGESSFIQHKIWPLLHVNLEFD